MSLDIFQVFQGKSHCIRRRWREKKGRSGTPLNIKHVVILEPSYHRVISPRCEASCETECGSRCEEDTITPRVDVSNHVSCHV